MSDRNQRRPLLAMDNQELESELSSLKVGFSAGFGTSNSSLCGTGLIAGGKFGYFSVCLDLDVIRVMFVEQK
jgi:hypothetical protein